MSQRDFQALLATLRNDFLDALPDRCDQIEALILALEKSWDTSRFEDLFRHVHSLKGSGGTHGLSIITAICHHLENLLTEAQDHHGFNRATIIRTLACTDLLRQVESEARQPLPSYAAIEAELDRLRELSRASRKVGLIAESSAAMSHLYQQAVESLPVQLRVTHNGLAALEQLLREPFDFIIVGRELRELNGIALLTALRASQTRNHAIPAIPAILVTSRPDGVPVHAGVTAIIQRGPQQSAQLQAAVRQTLLEPAQTDA